MFIIEADGTLTLPRDIGSTLSPRIGSGANIARMQDEMDAPQGYDERTVEYDPYI